MCFRDICRPKPIFEALLGQRINNKASAIMGEFCALGAGTIKHTQDMASTYVVCTGNFDCGILDFSSPSNLRPGVNINTITKNSQGRLVECYAVNKWRRVVEAPKVEVINGPCSSPNGTACAAGATGTCFNNVCRLNDIFQAAVGQIVSSKKFSVLGQPCGNGADIVKKHPDMPVSLRYGVCTDPTFNCGLPGTSGVNIGGAPTLNSQRRPVECAAENTWRLIRR